MNTLGLVLACVFGLLIGGAIGGFLVLIVQQLKSGKLKVPPNISIGPIKVDTSGISPRPEGSEENAGDGDLKPIIGGGSTATGGCLSLVGAILVLVGFVLPWFSCSVPILAIGGSMSGLSALVQLVVGVTVSFIGSVGVGTQRGGGGIATLGILLTLVLIAATLILVITPLMGLQIGRLGLKMIQTIKMDNIERRNLSRRIMTMAILGFIPLLCYLTSTMANFQIGARVNNLEVGLWITIAGFILAFFAGIIISVSASVIDQLSPSVTNNHKT